MSLEGESLQTSTLWTRSFRLVVLINFMITFGYQMFPTTLSLYTQFLGASDGVIGLLLGVSTLATIVSRFLTGIALDRYGKKSVLTLGIVLLAIAIVLYMFFPIIGIILAIRFLHGIGWGISSTAINTIATDLIPRQRFGEGMGFFGLSTSLPLAISPGVSIALYYVLGMRSIILISAGLILIALIFVLMTKHQEQSAQTPQPFAFSIVNSSTPVTLIMSCYIFSYGAISTFLPLYAAERNLGNIGTFFAVYAGTVFLVRPIAGRFADQKGYGITVIPGLGCMFIAFILLPISSSLWMLMISACLYGVSYGCVESNLYAMAIMCLPPERSGIANATFYIGVDGGIGVGSIIAGIVASVVGYRQMFFLLALFPVLTTFLFVVYIKKHPHEKEFQM